MESAIPDHLIVARTRQPRVREDYEPPYPSYVARHKPSVTKVAMAYFGLQFLADDKAQMARPLREVAEAFSDTDGPGHWDRARYTDAAGWENVVSIAYWDDLSAFERWFTIHGDAWVGEPKPGMRAGFFTEVLKPAVERYETLFSANDRLEGIAAIADGLSGMVREHAYWGGMRDRIPLSQTNDMAPAGAPHVGEDGAVRRVIPHENICLIRSGQDWTDADAEERRMYLEDVEPVLKAGMKLLRDEGLSSAALPTAICAWSARTGSWKTRASA